MVLQIFYGAGRLLTVLAVGFELFHGPVIMARKNANKVRAEVSIDPRIDAATEKLFVGIVVKEFEDGLVGLLEKLARIGERGLLMFLPEGNIHVAVSFPRIRRWDEGLPGVLATIYGFVVVGGNPV